MDGATLGKDVRDTIVRYVDRFDKQFSRFIEGSEANAFRTARAQDCEVSEEFAVLLAKADELRILTDGAYDPAVGGLLERAGYDAAYSMHPHPDVQEFRLPAWKLSGKWLSTDGPTVFDIGGMGKGYLIDKIAETLKSAGYEHFLVDGGGDMFGTSKTSGEPWRIAVEFPGREDTAAAVVTLMHQGLAVSDIFRRRWGIWHHVVDPRTNAPVEDVIGATALAPSAWAADCMTSALFLSTSERYLALSRYFKAPYLVFLDNGLTHVSTDWPGELVT